MSKVENAEKMDGNPPLKVLEGLLAEQRAKGGQGGKGRSVVYWLNLEDLRCSCLLCLLFASGSC